MAIDNTATDKQPLDQLKTSALDRRLSIAKASLSIGRRWATNSAFGLFKSKEEKAAQKHHRRDGAEYADTILITLGGIPLTERFNQPRQAHGDQESCHTA